MPRHQTVKVAPTDAGDKRYFVVSQRQNGTKLADSVRFRELTSKQVRMLQAAEAQRFASMQALVNKAPDQRTAEETEEVTMILRRAMRDMGFRPMG